MIDVVVDTTIIIDAAKIDRMDLFAAIRSKTFHVTDSVEFEITRRDQKEQLETLFDRNVILRERVDEIETLECYVMLRRWCDEGESSCLAFGKQNGWHVATDDVKKMKIPIALTVGSNRIIRFKQLLAEANLVYAE